ATSRRAGGPGASSGDQGQTFLDKAFGPAQGARDENEFGHGTEAEDWLGKNHMKPKGLRETTILMAVCNPFGYAFLEPSRGVLVLQISVATLVVAISYLVLWHYWKGRNWARILVLITSGVALLNLLAFSTSSSLQRGVIFAEALLGAYLFVWLNRRQVREFFRHGIQPTV
ncbi:MAG TPA: hypothetical protein VI454_02045, partial [Verrucomicrobiae bacterium]